MNVIIINIFRKLARKPNRESHEDRFHFLLVWSMICFVGTLPCDLHCLEISEYNKTFKTQREYCGSPPWFWCKALTAAYLTASTELWLCIFLLYYIFRIKKEISTKYKQLLSISRRHTWKIFEQNEISHVNSRQAAAGKCEIIKSLKSTATFGPLRGMRYISQW